MHRVSDQNLVVNLKVKFAHPRQNRFFRFFIELHTECGVFFLKPEDIFVIQLNTGYTRSREQVCTDSSTWKELLAYRGRCTLLRVR